MEEHCSQFLWCWSGYEGMMRLGKETWHGSTGDVMGRADTADWNAKTTPRPQTVPRRLLANLEAGKLLWNEAARIVASHRPFRSELEI